MARERAKPFTQVDSVTYKDKRRNIPTRELGDFVADAEAKPKAVLYPRDPSLDPQLVWKGKDEQDSKDLEVPAVPIYIQEKIHPKYIIEDLRGQASRSKPPQLELFADFNGIEFKEMVEFYQHEQNWSNRMILGDSLLVMTSLAEKEGLKGKVQMIYVDPPYGIKFGSNWQVSMRKRDVKDGAAEDATRQPEQIKAFRDTWKFGIHSYLAYLRDRFTVARDLLTETGSIFVQIGDENAHLVRCLMDEVFGSENHIATINYTKTSSQTSRFIPTTTDYIHWYAKNSSMAKYRSIYLTKSLGGEGSDSYQMVRLEDGSVRRLTPNEVENPLRIPPGAEVITLGDLTSQRQGRPSGPGTAMFYPIELGQHTYHPSGSRGWTTTKEGMRNLILAERVIPRGNSISYMRKLNDFPAYQLSNNWTDTSGTTDRVYVVQTNAKTIERCLQMTTDPGDLVLDPTGGGGTTAFVGEQWGRRWISIDTSRVALALARTRLMAAKFPYYFLADSPEGVKKEAEIAGRKPIGYRTEGDIRKGFVYKRVPHVTLKSIANNPDIKKGMTRQEIATAIARHAETEILFNEPYEDNSRIRVTGPFTVESLSPHRIVGTDGERPAAEVRAQKEDGTGQFETMIMENLKKAGVQNTFKNERLKFDHLDPYAGEWLHAAGEYTEKEGGARRVAVCIGPEHGTVGPELVKEAAKEAVKGIGFDLLIICGFAFDAHVSEEAKRYGKLNILVTHMNPDLAMGNELLKSTGAGNLFMVFGEPDVDIKKQKDSKIVVDIKGLDVYDPTTGQIRSNSTDDIACWFIDTDYNEESFFVRHAYFTGAAEPYEKLKRALRAEIDEAAWSSLYSTRSRPFDPPKTGKIAIKVINHYGDEVLKVYDIK